MHLNFCQSGCYLVSSRGGLFPSRGSVSIPRESVLLVILCLFWEFRCRFYCADELCRRDYFQCTRRLYSELFCLNYF